MTARPAGARSVERLGAPGGSAYISITDVDKSYGAESPIAALKDINLDIKAGEFISIVGPSGCGKSTLLKCIAGLQPISAGSISIRNQPVNAPPEDMAIVFQRDVLFDWRTVLDNVLMLVEFKGLRRKDYHERGLKLLREYGLDGYAQRFPWELSGGMRQRVAICRAIIVDPDLLLMDEPFGALDAMTRDDLNAELERLWYETRKTVVFITHGIDEAVYLGDRVVVMARNPGRIAEIVEIDIPRPRPLSIRQTEDFGKYVQHIRHLFASMGLVKAE
ncbi:ABC transporter related [Rhodopseudomonas palustris HaA2]|uniref:ABC transporter related n=1 Tax=Rhodopseudomonas palustris (strain HaA2) TaxID=316058 RepID=Q2IVH0_RHOP2|nr:ABC transporter ATP-binding protein [Rhodopseudomonas palustris]ABD07790.1 ABC transporter related [Rhodopseudomonas palustris HaA2]